ncbi:hypothetical protein RERY_07030 [Rhodococcus erythropolis]|nr:hypothetical protein RERY_07030 [Rhodococcus erythropolis]
MVALCQMNDASVVEHSPIAPGAPRSGALLAGGYWECTPWCVGDGLATPNTHQHGAAVYVGLAQVEG